MPDNGGRWFFVMCAVVALVLAGGVAYFADPDPDGLEAVTNQGCAAVEPAQGERMHDSCIARDAREHALADTPLAEYTIAGHEGLTGVAGVLGVLVTLMVAGGLFRLLRRSGG